MVRGVQHPNWEDDLVAHRSPSQPVRAAAAGDPDRGRWWFSMARSSRCAFRWS